MTPWRYYGILRRLDAILVEVAYRHDIDIRHGCQHLGEKEAAAAKPGDSNVDGHDVFQ